MNAYGPPPKQQDYKPAGLPAKHHLEYLKLAIELLLLLLAIPWLLRQLTTNPGELSRRAAGKHLKG